MEVRRLVPSDARAYRELRLRALRDHPEAFTSSYEEEEPKPLEIARKRLRASASVKMWGAFMNSIPVGMVGLDRETRMKNRHKATLVAMYVAPEAARQGVGRALVDALLAEARAGGVESLVLTVTQGNSTARELYARAGFTTFGIEPDAVRVAGQSYAKEHMYLKLGPP